MNQFYTRKNLLVALIILLATFSFFMLYSYRNMKKTVEETRSVNKVLKSLRTVESIMDDMQELEISISGYIISGNEDYLSNYAKAEKKLNSDTASIDELYTIYPHRVPLYEKLLQNIRGKKQTDASAIAVIKKEGAGAMIPAIESGLDKKYMDNIRELITGMESEDRIALNLSNDQRESAAVNTAKLFIILAFIFITGLFILYWRSTRDVEIRDNYEKRIAYLAGLTEKTNDAIISVDKDLLILSWNRGAVDMYGYTVEEAVGQSIRTLLNITSTTEDMAQSREMLNNQGYYNGEYESKTKSGELLFIKASISALKNDKNEFEGYVAVHHNATEQVKASRLLKKFNEQLSLQVEEKTILASSILERISDGFYSLDNQWRFTYMNNTAAAMMGCDPNEVIGKRLWEEFPDAVKLSIYDSYLEAFAIQQYRQVEFFYPPFQKWFMVDIYPSSTGISTFFRDITERKKVEEELRHSNDRFEMICRTTNDAVWEWNLETGQMWGNETHQQLYGFTLEDPVPSEKQWESRIHPEDRARLLKQQQDALDSDTNIFISEYRFNTEEKGYRNIYDRCYIIRDEKGRATTMLGSMMDITERKMAEEKLHRREAQLVASLENTPNVAVQWFNSKGEITYWNHASELVYGWTSQDATGKKLDQLILAPEEAMRFAESLREVEKTGRTIGPTEYIFHRKDGAGGTCLATIFSIPSIEGEPYFVCMDVDITESKRYAAALQQSEDRYRSMVEQASDGIFIMSGKGQYLDANSAGVAMLGSPKEEILKSYSAEFLPPGEIPLIQLKGEELKSGVSVILERRLKRKDGSILEVEGSYKMLPNGNILAIIRNIGERKKAEQELKTSEETRRLIMNSALDAIVGMDSNGLITVWTPQAEKIFGWNEAEVINRLMSEIIIPERLRSAHQNGLSRYLKTGVGPVLNKLIEIAALHRNGTEFPVELSIIPVKQGENEFFCAFIRDITERKKAEEEIRKAHERYEMIGKATNDAIWDVNLKTNEKWGNESLYQLYGLNRSVDILDDLEFYSRVHPDDLLELRKILDDAFQKQEPYIVGEFRFRMPDNTYRSFLDRAFIEYDEKSQPLRLIGAMQDVTEQRKIDQVIRDSEEKYRTLVEQAVDAIALYDKNGRILDVNTGSVNLLGYSKEELMQMSLPQILTSEEILEKPVRYDHLEQGASTVKERKMLKKDGSVVDTEVRSQQLPDGRFLSFIRDLTERKRAEQDLAASYEAIRKLTAHIQDIREEERANIAREIHDELGQQLTVLKMDVSWLKKKVGNEEGPVKEKIKDLINMLDETVRSVRRISSELRPSLLDDLGLIAAMEWQLGEFEKRSEINTSFLHPEIEMKLPETVKTALFRIFQESLTNVARHSEAKNVSVSIGISEGELFLSVADDGKGFDRQKVADKKTLGILGMQERIAMIGGVYEINSMPGKGTEVLVHVTMNDFKTVNNDQDFNSR